MHPDRVDLLVVGGGINGAGIARDAAGRGLSVLLVEQGDLGCATSSASSKLIHGGLRYLEQYEFRLVREALAEREVLLRSAPHIVRPMRFVMPHVPELRPAWVIRLGLVLYDYLGRRHALPGSHGVDLARSRYGAGLKPQFKRGFVYSDCQVDDARLVVLTARAAADLGAAVMPRTRLVAAERAEGVWRAELRSEGGTRMQVEARAVANVAGPWVKKVLTDILRQPSTVGLRLVQGSHIVVPRLYEGDHAFILQNDDRRVIFACPYQGRYTLVGTTEVTCEGDPARCEASVPEIEYLCRAVNRYFLREVGSADVAWSYCGIRPLFDDGSANPSMVTRDYMLRVDGARNEAPVLSVFGGKITTHRRLAEHALSKLAPWFPAMGEPWTADALLPGGDIARGDVPRYVDTVAQAYPFLPRALLCELARRHGTRCSMLLDGVTGVSGLGEHFGADLYAKEVDYLVAHEWAGSAEDVLWRRTKAGLRLDSGQQEAVRTYLARHAAARFVG
ncbi:MAG: glycerol-3-phosphate dehydrogenase [Betaproteobacteria bacterium]|nr:glycerol-3-phosphate dehydrogenase [Betaproteobacteria bacterium]